jgi:hypothetical protein
MERFPDLPLATESAVRIILLSSGVHSSIKRGPPQPQFCGEIGLSRSALMELREGRSFH